MSNPAQVAHTQSLQDVALALRPALQRFSATSEVLKAQRALTVLLTALGELEDSLR